MSVAGSEVGFSTIFETLFSGFLAKKTIFEKKKFFFVSSERKQMWRKKKLLDDGNFSEAPLEKLELVSVCVQKLCSKGKFSRWKMARELLILELRLVFFTLNQLRWKKTRVTAFLTKITVIRSEKLKTCFQKTDFEKITVYMKQQKMFLIGSWPFRKDSDKLQSEMCE